MEATPAPLVTVVVPVYNACHTLRACVESITTQRYTALQIVLVNDGSRDESLALCRQLAATDARITVLTHENAGVSATRNAGLSIARGEYIAFVDSDDRLAPDAFSRLVARMRETHSDLTLATFYMTVGSKSSLRGCIRRDDEMDLTPYMQYFAKAPGSFYFSVLWNKLYRADIIRDNGVRFDEALHWGEDFDFNVQYLRYARAFATLAEPTYYYIRNPHSATLCSLTPRKLYRITCIKRKLYRRYKALYEELGLYHSNRLRVKMYFWDFGVFN